MRQRIINKICPIILLFVVFITAVSFGFLRVHAGGGFVENSDAWSSLKNSIHASPTDTYPYDIDKSNTNVKVSSVSLDILYGASKGFGLTQYHGEVPYAQVYDDKGEIKADGFGNIYARPGTTIESGSTNNPGGVDAKTYWGFDSGTSIKIDGTDKTFSSGSQQAKLSEYEKINDEKIVSLRLYALANTTGGFWGVIGQFFSNLLYVIGVGLAMLATLLLSLIVSAKNIDVESILKMFKLQEVSELMTNSFIFDGKQSALSPFTLFAIVMFIFAIVACAVRYAKGADKKTGLKDILVTAATALLVIGICLSGNIVSLGSSASDLANGLMATAAGVSSSTNGGAFTTVISDKEHTNKVAQLNEMTLVNKIFIDMQICAQFGVSKISDLDVEQLGDTNADIANKGYYTANNASTQVGPSNGILMQYVDPTTPTGASAPTMKSEFDNNLGYYFWFANSSASKKTAQNINYPSTDSNAINDKMDGMITYLQAVYNKNIAVNTSDSLAKNNTIRKIILSLAIPNGASGCLSLLLLTAVLVVMGLCLLKYCLNAVIGKLELFVAILGLTVAGPLMLTTNKKLVTTGKAILGMIPVAFIEITVYSVIFDIILFLVATLMSTNVLQMIVVLALLLMLMKLNPVIQEKIKQLLDNATRAISPAFANAKRSVKAYTRQKFNNLMTNYDKSKKVVGHDKDGNAITQERGGNALSKLMHQSYNAIYNDGMQRETIRKINKQQTETHDRNVNKSAEEKRRDAEARVNAVMDEIKDKSTELENDVKAAEKDFQDDCYYKNGNENVYNNEKLTDEEKTKLQELEKAKSDAAFIKNDTNYTRLMKLQANYETENNKHKDEEGYVKLVLSEADDKELKELKNKLADKQTEIKNLDADIKRSIDARARAHAFDKVGLDKNAEGKTEEEKLKNATKQLAQTLTDDQGKVLSDKLHKALQDGLNTIKDEVNTKQASKIGSKDATVNRAAVTASAAMMYQMKELDEGKVVSDTNTAKGAVSGAVDMVIQRNDSHNKSSKIADAKAEVGEAYSLHTLTQDKETRVENRKNAKANLKDTKAEIKAEKKEGKQNYKTSKKQHGRALSTATISEQLETAVRSGSVTPTNAEELAKAAMNKEQEIVKGEPVGEPTVTVGPTTEVDSDPWLEAEAAEKEELARRSQRQAQAQQQQAQAQAQSQTYQQTSSQTQQSQPNQRQTQQPKPQPQPQPQPQKQQQTQQQSSQPKPQPNQNQQTQQTQSNQNQQTSQPTKPQPNQQQAQQTQQNQPKPQNSQPQPQATKTVEDMAKEKAANMQPNEQQSTQNNPNIKLNIQPNNNRNAAQEASQMQQNIDNRAQFSRTPQPDNTANTPTRTNIEDVRPIHKDRSEYTKDEGRESAANEKFKGGPGRNFKL